MTRERNSTIKEMVDMENKWGYGNHPVSTALNAHETMLGWSQEREDADNGIVNGISEVLLQATNRQYVTGDYPIKTSIRYSSLEEYFRVR